MKVNCGYIFRDLVSGQDIVTDNDGKPLTLGMVAAQSVVLLHDRDKDMPGDEKMRLYNIGLKMVSGSEADLTSDEAAVLKARLALFFGPVIVGQAWPLLDGK